tara:strand:+ start:201 stop:356 length:156 start_codon:yes stop_codon:yes gene_type:complete
MQTVKVKVKVQFEEVMEIDAEYLVDYNIEEYVDENFEHEWDIADYIEIEVV